MLFRVHIVLLVLTGLFTVSLIGSFYLLFAVYFKPARLFERVAYGNIIIRLVLWSLLALALAIIGAWITE